MLSIIQGNLPMPYEDIILTHFLFKGRHSLTTRIYAKIKVRLRTKRIFMI
jgi:hypothetical protein